MKSHNPSPHKWSLPAKRRLFARWVRAICLGIFFFLISVLPSAGQCGNSLNTRSYDTLLTGPGYGTYTVTFPKWNPDSGLLASVTLSALVSQQYSFTLVNADVTPSVYTILAGRYDQISGPAMSTPYSNTTVQTVGVYSLSPGVSASRTPFTLLQNYSATDSISGPVAPFAGTGYLSFVYAPITYSDIHTNNNSSYSYGAAAPDSIHFSITYQYCAIGVLASSLIRWAAVAQDASTVALSWTMANEEAGRDYEVQESVDGTHFTTVGLLASVAGGTGNAEYEYLWNVPGTQTTAPAKWYFRLKIDAPGGANSYSDIKIVTLSSDAGDGMRLYPNPATDLVNIDLPFADMAGDWQIDLFSADGRLLQRERYSYTRTARLNFRQALARGIYFIRAANIATGKIYSSSFLSR